MSTTEPFRPPEPILEGRTVQYRCGLLNEEGASISTQAIDAMRMTYYSRYSGEIINERNNQNVLNTNGVTVENGTLVWTLAEADVIIVDQPKPRQVTHRAVLVIEYRNAENEQRQLVREIDIPLRSAQYAPFAEPEE